MNAFVVIRLTDGIDRGIEDGYARRALFEWACWVVPLGLTEIWLTWWPALRRTWSVRRPGTASA